MQIFYANFIKICLDINRHFFSDIFSVETMIAHIFAVIIALVAKHALNPPAKTQPTLP